MSLIPPIFVTVYLISIICRASSFQVSQIQFKYLFQSKISCWWILDKREDLHFLTCSQMCWRNSECYGIALGALKENRVDNKRDCYLLKRLDVSEQYCTVEDYDEEEVEFYEKIEPETITSTTTAEPTTTTEVTTTEKLPTSVETTSLSDDAIDAEMSLPACVRYLNSTAMVCRNNPERSVIVAMKANDDSLFSGGSFFTLCAEPFYLQDILSSGTVFKRFYISDGSYLSCGSRGLLAGFLVCLNSFEEIAYRYYMCKELLDGFVKGDPVSTVANGVDPAEIKCPPGAFIDLFQFSVDGKRVWASCIKLERDENM